MLGERNLTADCGLEEFSGNTPSLLLEGSHLILVIGGKPRTCVVALDDEGNLIRARLTPKGYEELSRVHVINPTCSFGGRKVVWPPPAYANQHIFVRNEEELICASLEVPGVSSGKPRAPR